MKKPPLHRREQERLQALQAYNILDTVSEEEYDALTRIASLITDTPISLITLVDRDRQWFKSKQGIDIDETPRQYAFCAHTIIEEKQVFTVEDASKDERFFDNPLVLEDPAIRFYSGVPLRTADGLPLGTLCVIDHKPKQLTDEQHKALQDLAGQAMKLLELRKLNNDMVHQMQQMEKMNKDLEQLTHVMAHDLKTPLNNILGLTEMLRMDCDNGDLNSSMQEIQRITQSSQRMKDMIDGLLRYFRGDATSEQEARLLKWAEIKKNIEVHFSADQQFQLNWHLHTPTVYANPLALEHVLMNLIGNAVKYNDKAVAEVTIEASEYEDEYRIEVTDNGPGIPENMDKKLFQLFHRGTQRDRKGEKGTGMGLAMVKKWMHEMKGEVVHDNTHQPGTRMVLSLPKPITEVQPEKVQ